VLGVEAWTTIRYLQAQGVGIRAICRELGVSRTAVRCALRRIRTVGTAEGERSVRREAYGDFGDAEWVGATVACGSNVDDRCGACGL